MIWQKLFLDLCHPSDNVFLIACSYSLVCTAFHCVIHFKATWRRIAFLIKGWFLLYHGVPTTYTAIHMRDSGHAVARDPNRIQLDPKFVGCTIAALVCGPIGNGCGCESRFVARVRTLTFRLPYPYRLFRSSTYTVKAYEPIPYRPFYMERYPLPPPPPTRLACVH